MTVLVAGGAGYIGAHVVRLLAQQGRNVVVVDDLTTGDASRIGDAPLVQLDIAADSSRKPLAAVMREHEVTAVINFAAKKQVGESVSKPARYFQQNVGGLANLLEAMEETGVDRMVVSSSAAVYGIPALEQVDERQLPQPINPYGETKLVGEWLVADAATAWGLRGANLRYFNVAGAGWDDLGDPAALNLVTMVFEKMDAGAEPLIFGDDYPTPDGTCIRDYVHVLDLAEAHIAALDYLDRDDRPHSIFNVGTGSGASVADVIREIGVASEKELTPIVVDRRPGDPAQLIADVKLIADELGWTSKYDLPEIIRSAWSAHVFAG
ncbi:UDP-glucose 4-epimerase GalE [Homoserinimonas sp. OAct 916]|uniref:UDP-glucose 4-epimerase GalE n=1 Tax=Homoserinimonas sp. OAct 916 TaxID=2211450 RepID=UPI000DBE48DD|nr:UDP-glucose 4-epimerase GalE [Homoserinimonas sp. OAct 916]